mmetsp:Transcript_28858/g.38479  ORF Transcript_28858/g.38479 Transcript_28858/m.38479 type:complete len:141 (-) Transcript_28858:827-1249(-)
MRRYLIIFVLVIYPDHVFTQLYITLFAAMFITIYTLVARPFEQPIMNKQETVNEVAVWSSTYMLFAYTDIISDAADLDLLGWCSIGMIGLTVLVNLLFMCYITCLQVQLRLKKRTNLQNFKLALARKQADKQRCLDTFKS